MAIPNLLTGSTQSDIWLAATIVVCIAVGVFTFLLFHPIHSNTLRPENIFHDAETCKMILASGRHSSEQKNRLLSLESRAIPNQRLVRAFDIDNAFTTSTETRRTEFKNDARKAIALSEWKRIADSAKELVRVGIAAGAPTAIPLDTFVRSVCLKIVLHKLFGGDPLRMEDEPIVTIADSINKLWIQSKGSETPEGSRKRELRKALNLVLPDLKDSEHHEKPLNLILPAYETLWRVVLSCFVEVTYRPEAKLEWRTSLKSFLVNPTKDAFENPSPELDAVPAQFIVKEALRLYPSTKRVYRQLLKSYWIKTELVAADIEACHRDSSVWGANALSFDPSRWVNLDSKAENSYMPFGAMPFVCPARAKFGPRMIAVLVAALVENIDPKVWSLEINTPGSLVSPLQDAMNGIGALVSDRTAYVGVEIIRKSS